MPKVVRVPASMQDGEFIARAAAEAIAGDFDTSVALIERAIEAFAASAEPAEQGVGRLLAEWANTGFDARQAARIFGISGGREGGRRRDRGQPLRAFLDLPAGICGLRDYIRGRMQAWEAANFRGAEAARLFGVDRFASQQAAAAQEVREIHTIREFYRAMLDTDGNRRVSKARTIEAYGRTRFRGHLNEDQKASIRRRVDALIRVPDVGNTDPQIAAALLIDPEGRERLRGMGVLARETLAFIDTYCSPIGD